MHDINEEGDEMISRIVAELKTLPPVPADATARVLARVDAARRSEGTSRFGRRFSISLPAAIGYAVAATLAGFLIRGAVPRHPSEPTPRGIASAPVGETLGIRTPIVPAAANTRALEEAPVKVQFVLEAPRAKSVTVVGDFNAWDGSRTPLDRDSTTGVWSALVDVHPGRHVYAFLVDGKTWTLDPNAPRTKDLDYGTTQSVLMVGMR
ncbi:MAG TPA: isoamylase early set domain-containing protein [Gemmatimonadaceae bacterium]|nr:isoamylase early set domain-containing protein [Gemmatimonadaceae bacterium]